MTTLKFNPSFSIMGKRILLQAHLRLLTCCMHILILFAWLKLILQIEFTLFCDLFFLVGVRIFKQWSRSTPCAFKGGDKIPQKKGGLLSHLLPHLRNGPTHGSQVLSLDS
jgi:hypothetical protein